MGDLQQPSLLGIHLGRLVGGDVEKGVIETVVADVADPPALTAAVRGLADKLGPVDLLVANAGVALPSGAADPGAAANVERMVRVNLLGVVYAFDAVLPDMLRRGAGHLPQW